MTQMETILDHVVNQVHVNLEQWKQLMNYYQELACLTDLGDYGGSNHMEGKLVSCEFTKFQVANAHFGHDALYLQVAILGIQHLVDKLTK